jgi:hypothetical protein
MNVLSGARTEQNLHLPDQVQIIENVFVDSAGLSVLTGPGHVSSQTIPPGYPDQRAPFQVPLPSAPAYLRVSLFVISNGTVEMRSVHCSCRIQVTQGARFEATNVIFERPLSQKDPAIEVMNRATVKLSHCNFKDAGPTPVVLRLSSKGTFEECVFHGSEHTAILGLAKSEITVKNCHFEQTARFSVYVTDADTTASVDRCTFADQPGKAVLAMKSATATVTNCHFTQCKGGVNAGNSARVTVANCWFSDMRGTCILCTRDCTLGADQCHIEKATGKEKGFWKL